MEKRLNAVCLKDATVSTCSMLAASHARRYTFQAVAGLRTGTFTGALDQVTDMLTLASVVAAVDAVCVCVCVSALLY